MLIILLLLVFMTIIIFIYKEYSIKITGIIIDKFFYPEHEEKLIKIFYFFGFGKKTITVIKYKEIYGVVIEGKFINSLYKRKFKLKKQIYDDIANGENYIIYSKYGNLYSFSGSMN